MRYNIITKRGENTQISKTPVGDFLRILMAAMVISSSVGCSSPTASFCLLCLSKIVSIENLNLPSAKRPGTILLPVTLSCYNNSWLFIIFSRLNEIIYLIKLSLDNRISTIKVHRARERVELFEWTTNRDSRAKKWITAFKASLTGKKQTQKKMKGMNWSFWIADYSTIKSTVRTFELHRPATGWLTDWVVSAKLATENYHCKISMVNVFQNVDIFFHAVIDCIAQFYWSFSTSRWQRRHIVHHTEDS